MFPSLFPFLFFFSPSFLFQVDFVPLVDERLVPLCEIHGAVGFLGLEHCRTGHAEPPHSGRGRLGVRTLASSPILQNPRQHTTTHISISGQKPSISQPTVRIEILNEGEIKVLTLRAKKHHTLSTKGGHEITGFMLMFLTEAKATDRQRGVFIERMALVG